jgi:hypothetical protein
MPTSAATVVPGTSLARKAGDRVFYSGIALTIAATVFTGFFATFYNRDAGLRPLSPLLVAHGIAFTVWVLLFVTQTALIAARRVKVHQRLGIAGAFLALLMVGLGLAAAIAALRLGRAPIPGLDPRSFFAVPFFDIVAFAILIGTGLSLRRDPEAHKRLMLLGMIAVIDAAVARLPLEFIGSGGPLVFFAVTDLFIVAGVVYDLITRRRVHRAYVWGGLLFVLSQPLRLAISGTPAWLAFADLFR